MEGWISECQLYLVKLAYNLNRIDGNWPTVTTAVHFTDNFTVWSHGLFQTEFNILSLATGVLKVFQ